MTVGLLLVALLGAVLLAVVLLILWTRHHTYTELDRVGADIAKVRPPHEVNATTEPSRPWWWLWPIAAWLVLIAFAVWVLRLPPRH